MPLMRTRTWLVAALVAVVGTVAAPAVRPTHAQQAAVARVTGALGELLRRYAEILPLDIRLDPAVAGAAVDIDATGLSPYVALREILLASGVDYVIVQRGERYSLVAGDAAQAVSVEGDASPAAATEPAPESGERASAAEPDAESDAPASAPVAGGVTASSSRPAGEMTAADLAAILSGPARPPSNEARWVELPFRDDQGQPIRVWRPAGTPPVVELPFVDSAGQPVVQVVPARPLGVIELPFPDANGRPLLQVTAPTAAPSSTRTPGLLPGAKPPGPGR